MPKRPVLLVIGILISLLLFFGAAMVIELRAQEKNALRFSQDVARTLAEMLRNDIEERITLPALFDSLDDKRRYRFFDELVRHNLLNSSLKKVKVFNKQGRIIYAENPELLGQDHSGKALLQRALRGEFASKIVDTREYEDAYGVKQTTSLIETYMPVLDNHGKITHVMEVYQNFDPIRGTIHASLWRSGLLLGLMAALSFSMIAFLLKKLQGISKERDLLEALLPICSFCKKIREKDEKGGDQWVQLEQYLHDTKDLHFSHSVCHECMKKHYPEVSQ